MKKMFTSQDVTLVGFYQSILEANGIKTIVKNYYLSSGVGDLPANAVFPELWILEDDQYQAAKGLLIAKKESPWQCQCGENISGQFAQCWKCGKLREN